MTYFQRLLLLIVLVGLPTLLKAQIGDTAPDFTVVDTHGNPHHLYEYLDSGKYVILDFFFTTCIPCQYYTPQVNLAFEKYGCNNAETIFMSIDEGDTDAEVIAYDELYQIEYPSVSGVSGGGNVVVNSYGIFSFPTFYLIDSTKKIIDIIDPPTLQVFDFRFANHGIQPASCTPTNVLENFGQNSIRLFPNPASGESVKLDLTELKSTSMTVQISTFMGQELKTIKLDNTAGKLHEIPIGKLPAGTYLLQVSDEIGNKYFSKLAVVR